MAIAEAPAAIVYHPISNPPEISFFPDNPRQDFDIDGNGSIDFAIVVLGLATTLSAPGQSAIFGRDYPSTTTDLGSKVIPLAFGEEIGPLLAANHEPLAGFYNDATEGGPHLLAGTGGFGGGAYGEFAFIRAYAGVRFEIDGEPHYAWLDLENSTLGPGAGFRIHGWAYETEENTSRPGSCPSQSARFCLSPVVRCYWRDVLGHPKFRSWLRSDTKLPDRSSATES